MLADGICIRISRCATHCLAIKYRTVKIKKFMSGILSVRDEKNEVVQLNPAIVN